MVSSRLNCNTAVHLLSVSDNGGDLDGPLLVDEPSQLFEVITFSFTIFLLRSFLREDSNGFLTNPNQAMKIMD